MRVIVLCTHLLLATLCLAMLLRGWPLLLALPFITASSMAFLSLILTQNTWCRLGGYIAAGGYSLALPAVLVMGVSTFFGNAYDTLSPMVLTLIGGIGLLTLRQIRLSALNQKGVD